MKHFTLQLSKQEMSYLLLNLPKGYSFVKTSDLQKKKSKSIKNTIQSDHESSFEASQETKQRRSKGKQKGSKSSLKSSVKTQEAKTQRKDVSGQSPDDKCNFKKRNGSKKISKNIKNKHEIYDSNSEEETNSEQIVKQKANSKKDQIKIKIVSKESTATILDKKSALKKIQERKKNDVIQQEKLQEKRKQPQSNDTLDVLIQNTKKENSQSHISVQKPIQRVEIKPEPKSSKQNKSQNSFSNNETEKEADLNRKNKSEGKNSKKVDKKSVKAKIFSYDDRLGIISRIRNLDRETLAQFFQAIKFSKGETLDFKVIDDKSLEEIEHTLRQHEAILKRKITQRGDQNQITNPKKISDFEIAEDKDYDD